MNFIFNSLAEHERCDAQIRSHQARMQSRLHDLEEQAVRERARAKERDLEYTSQTGQLTSQLHEAAEQARRSEEKVECVRSRVQVAESHADGLEELLGIARAQVERLRTTVANTTSEKARQATRAIGEYLLVNCVHHYPRSTLR